MPPLASTPPPAPQPSAGHPVRTLLDMPLATTFDAVSEAGERLGVLLDQAFDETRAAQLRLGLVEALTNVVEHGCQGRPDGYLHLRATAGPSQWCFRLMDDGLPIPTAALASADGSVFGFDPDARDTLPEGGMGLSLIRMVFDRVDYRSSGGRNELILTVYQAP
jgi:serine/threonine-protein kinase RsbW